MANNGTPIELRDALFDFQQGVNGGISSLLIPKNQLAAAMNMTVRGTLCTHRPVFRKMTLNYGGNASLQTAFETGLFQEACYCKPDNAPETLMAAISGNLYQLVIGATSATVADRTGGNPQDATAVQHWMWQSEYFVIWNDGINVPVFFNSTANTTAASNYGTKVNDATTTTAPFLIPAVGSTVNVPLTSLGAVPSLAVGVTVNLRYYGQFVVQNIAVLTATLLNINAGPVGQNVASGSTLTWSTIGVELPPGRMGAYGMGRNWMCLIDGKQFVAGDIEGGPSGTSANDYRDAVINVTENFFLVGGGNFSVPGSLGEITGMIFASTLDASLGQGPLQVFTSNAAFSCNAPVDRLTWQNLTNPILTESMIGQGGRSHWALANGNSDIFTRDLNGVVSMLLARRDYNTWGNTPISREVGPILNKDNQGLLQFTSAIVFDNRYLMTCRPTQHDQGVYNTGILALNFDPISSIRGKAPSVWDGLWTGLNTLKLVKGMFGGYERAFAFTLNTTTRKIELYEILKTEEDERQVSPGKIYDNGDTRVVWSGESPALFRYPETDPRSQMLKRLLDGELQIDQMVGPVNFQIFWKPDQWPCWIPWFAWDECANTAQVAEPNSPQPQFRPRMGFGEPPVSITRSDGTVISLCDPTTNRPFRNGYTFQIKWIITGHCRAVKFRLKGVTIPEDQFAPVSCTPCHPSLLAEFLASPQETNPIVTVIGDVEDTIVGSGGTLLGG